jgi:hypothetical protein
MLTRVPAAGGLTVTVKLKTRQIDGGHYGANPRDVEGIDAT